MSDYQQVEPPIQSRLWDVLKTIRTVLGAALESAQPAITDPIMVLVGYPTWTEGAKVWGQPIDPGFVTIDALPDLQKITKYTPQWGVVGPMVSGFTRTFTPTSVTFAPVVDVIPTGTNVHAIFNVSGVLYDAHYQALENDTATLVAAGLANSLNNEAPTGKGVSASSSGNTTNIVGANFVGVNVVGIGEAHLEVARVSRTVQVSIWVSSPWARFQVEDVIVSHLGTSDEPWLQLPDGGWALVQLRGEKMIDQSQLSYNLYECHLSFYVEYSIIQRAPAYQIGAIDLSVISEVESGLTMSKIIY